jgi:hypothetical protein
VWEDLPWRGTFIIAVRHVAIGFISGVVILDKYLFVQQ